MMRRRISAVVFAGAVIFSQYKAQAQSEGLNRAAGTSSSEITM
jgi:hypothetical protein